MNITHQERAFTPIIDAQEIGNLAIAALRLELACYPKPGLVSFVDCGSHDDMTAETFLASIAALKSYFTDITQAGANGARFPVLRRLGLEAEYRMFNATGNVNTHRGAIFILGLLCAAAGELSRRHKKLHAEAICQKVRDAWAENLRDAEKTAPVSHGCTVRNLYGAGGARSEAINAFPILRARCLPAYRAARKAGKSEHDAGVQAFFESMAALDDTNLLYRGGTEGFGFARAQAQRFLSDGGVHCDGWNKRAARIHTAFLRLNLSPGGSADMLAATYFLMALEAGALFRWG